VKARLTRLFSILASVILGLFLAASPVLAISSPDSIQIDSVYVYHHCLETDDQLYLVEYYVNYGANPDENITEAYLGRLMDGLDELGVVAPYAYFDEGYDKGIFAIYFSADDAPPWDGDYTMKLMGNPMLSWTGDIPTISVSTFDLWSSSDNIAQTQIELASRILYIADQLELTWAINMIDSTGSGSYLSDYGESYFTNAIPGIRTMAPRAFAGSTTSPEWDAKEPVTTYAEDRADSVEDTPLDMTLVADWWGVSRMWASSICFMLGAVFLLFTLLKPTGSFKGLTFLSTPLIIAGGYLGMVPLQVTVISGFAAFALSVFFLFYHPSGV